MNLQQRCHQIRQQRCSQSDIRFMCLSRSESAFCPKVNLLLSLNLLNLLQKMITESALKVNLLNLLFITESESAESESVSAESAFA